MKCFFISKRKTAGSALAFVLLACTVGLFDLDAKQLVGTVSAAVNKVNPIYFVHTEVPKISISFDATWGAEHTEKILANLEKHQVKGTFFLTNIWLKAYPEVAEKIAAQGHEIAMHSVSHPHMNGLSEAEIKQEITANAQMITDITHYKPILFRFPFGEYNNQSVNAVKGLGYYPVQWSIDSLDWKEDMSQEEIVTRVVQGMHNGAIILCHNNGTYTAEAIDEILTAATEAGYQVVPIGELIVQGAYTVDHQGGQKAAE